MDNVFADACYWIAKLSRRDSLHEIAVLLSDTLDSRRIVTTELVLVEVLNFFANWVRQIVAAQQRWCENSRLPLMWMSSNYRTSDFRTPSISTMVDLTKNGASSIAPVS